MPLPEAMETGPCPRGVDGAQPEAAPAAWGDVNENTLRLQTRIVAVWCLLRCPEGRTPDVRRRRHGLGRGSVTALPAVVGRAGAPEALHGVAPRGRGRAGPAGEGPYAVVSWPGAAALEDGTAPLSSRGTKNSAQYWDLEFGTPWGGTPAGPLWWCVFFAQGCRGRIAREVFTAASGADIPESSRAPGSAER